MADKLSSFPIVAAIVTVVGGVAAIGQLQINSLREQVAQQVRATSDVVIQRFIGNEARIDEGARRNLDQYSRLRAVETALARLSERLEGTRGIGEAAREAIKKNIDAIQVNVDKIQQGALEIARRGK